MLAEGYSSLDNEIAVISAEPFAATWLLQREDRTPRVKLVANPHYWDTARGPRLQEVIFRNDLSPAQAMELVCTTEGEVDIVTEVSPADAARVENSAHAKLVAIDPLRAIAGVINRQSLDLPLHDTRARQALNLAIDRDKLVREGLLGRGLPLAGLTPPSAVTILHRLSPYAHNPEHAAELWREAGGTAQQTLKIAVPHALESLAQLAAADLRQALDLRVDLSILSEGENNQLQRQLAEKETPAWDILLYAWTGQEADAPPLEIHYSFVGAQGQLRAGPVVPAFEDLYAEMVRQTSPILLADKSYRLDRLVREEALALFLCAPQALYAVNKHVDFKPYRSTFELADCQVGPQHWSRQEPVS